MSTEENSKADLLKSVAEMVLCGNNSAAGSTIRAKYPFTPIEKETRRYSEIQQMEQFFKDGFIDRYFGTRLVNPGMLRVLSEMFPEEFPYQAHWRTQECHIAYWDYQPTLDHIVPIAQGGKNEPSNWITTSMKGNLAKNNFTLAQLHWQLYPKGNLDDWDGLSRIFIEIVDQYPGLTQVAGIRKWDRATRTVMEAEMA